MDYLNTTTYTLFSVIIKLIPSWKNTQFCTADVRVPFPLASKINNDFPLFRDESISSMGAVYVPALKDLSYKTSNVWVVMFKSPLVLT